MLFDRNELTRKVFAFDVFGTVPLHLEINQFDQICFDSPSSEQSILVASAPKNLVHDVTEFWLFTMLAHDWSGREQYFKPYAETALCRDLLEDDYLGVIDVRTGRLRRTKPECIDRPSGFMAALKMYDDWNDVATIAEYDSFYVAFYWCTTA